MNSSSVYLSISCFFYSLFSSPKQNLTLKTDKIDSETHFHLHRLHLRHSPLSMTEQFYTWTINIKARKRAKEIVESFPYPFARSVSLIRFGSYLLLSDNRFSSSLPTPTQSCFITGGQKILFGESTL